MPSFCPEYLDQIDTNKINTFCKKCGDYKDGLCELANDKCGPVTRFLECDALQEAF